MLKFEAGWMGGSLSPLCDVLRLRFNVPVYSTLYAGIDCGEWCARPTARFLQLLHGSGAESIRWIVSVGGMSVALGDPIPDTQQAAVYVPQWILDASSAQGQGEIVSVECIAAERLPRAERLCFRVIGDLPEDVDVRELLEGALSQLGVLSLGQMIPVPAFEGCVLMVEACEPAEHVFLDGAEVALEIERESASAAASASASASASVGAVPPVAPPVASQTTSDDFFSTGMVPVEEPVATISQTQGNRLGGGGTGRSRLI